MNEQFDRKLRNHIKDTFDHYDDQMADNGWNKFIANKKRKRRGLIYWTILPTGIAATLALVWLFNGNNLLQTVQKKEPIIAHNGSTNNKINKQSEWTSNHSQPPKFIKDKVIDENKTAINPFKNNKPISSIRQEKGIIQKTELKTTKIDLLSKTNSKTANLKELIVIRQLSKSEVMAINPSVIMINSEINDVPLLESSNVIREDKIIAEEKEQVVSNAIKIKKEPKIIQFLGAIKDAPPTKKKSNFNLSIDANSYYSFSEKGVNDQLNIGLGLATELKITENLSLNSGILLNRQTTTFDGNERSTSDFRLAVNGLGAVPSAQMTSAKLIGLDIPLNLKYDVKLGKMNSFIATGFSSYSVINENYINDFSIVNYSFTGVNTSSITTKVENPLGNFSYFKFARTLNLSFGVLYPIAKKSTLSIEPFMKYPLRGLGYQDLKIGSGGLSFKLNFGN